MYNTVFRMILICWGSVLRNDENDFLLSSSAMQINGKAFEGTNVTNTLNFSLFPPTLEGRKWWARLKNPPDHNFLLFFFSFSFSFFFFLSLIKWRKTSIYPSNFFSLFPSSLFSSQPNTTFSLSHFQNWTLRLEFQKFIKWLPIFSFLYSYICPFLATKLRI